VFLIMAFSAHRDPSMLEELRESSDVVRAKAAELAALMKSARRVVVFTGAGISTDAGIADYRGPTGVWTLEAKGEGHRIQSVDMISALPTPTHMALVVMLKRGLIHHIISQNLDGLHRKSGVPKEQISELHGNSNVEYCSSCRREYLRDFGVQTGSSSAKNHQTGRRCVAANCCGLLCDTIINFGEQLPLEMVEQGFAQSRTADVHIVLGSSLTVSPACNMPKETKTSNGKLAIVNLQRTPLDSMADIRVHCGISEFIAALSAELGFKIPPFWLSRAAALWRTEDGDVHSAALDPSDLAPATLLRRCAFEAGDDHQTVEGGDDIVILKAEKLLQAASKDREVRVHFEFYGHYSEPSVELVLPQGASLQHFQLTLDPRADSKWTVEAVEGGKVPSCEDILPGKGGTAGTAWSLPTTDTTDYSGWFAVQPVSDCPHTCTHVLPADGFTFDPRARCQTCGNVGENMLCLACHAIHCGRHVGQHMLAHNAATSHPMVCGFIDLSFWCYNCDTYISPSNAKLSPYYAAMHTAKFGAPPPKMARRAKITEVPEGSATTSDS